MFSFLQRKQREPDVDRTGAKMAESDASFVERHRVRNLLLPGMRVVGSIEVPPGEGICVDCVVIGNVILREQPDVPHGGLLIGRNGLIVGDVWARYVRHHGRIEGRLTAYRAYITGSMAGPNSMVRWVHPPVVVAEAGAQVTRMQHVSVVDYPPVHEVRNAVANPEREQLLDGIAAAEAMTTISRGRVVVRHPAPAPVDDELAPATHSQANTSARGTSIGLSLQEAIERLDGDEPRAPRP